MHTERSVASGAAIYNPEQTAPPQQGQHKNGAIRGQQPDCSSYFESSWRCMVKLGPRGHRHQSTPHFAVCVSLRDNAAAAAAEITLIQVIQSKSAIIITIVVVVSMNKTQREEEHTTRKRSRFSLKKSARFDSSRNSETCTRFPTGNLPQSCPMMLNSKCLPFLCFN